MKNDNNKIQEALTVCYTIAKVEIPLSSGTFPTSRYSLIQIYPETGRRHQIRRHLAHILHPIIGDRPHGCNKQNRFFNSQFGMNTMMLHASELTFSHPVLQNEIKIVATIGGEFERMYNLLGFGQAINP